MFLVDGCSLFLLPHLPWFSWGPPFPQNTNGALHIMYVNLYYVKVIWSLNKDLYIYDMLAFHMSSNNYKNKITNNNTGYIRSGQQ